MSDWNTRKGLSTTNIANAGQHSASFFETKNPEPAKTAYAYESQRRAEELAVAYNKVTDGCNEIFALIEKLGGQQVFRQLNGETPLREAIFDAMGNAAVELLNLEQNAPEHNAGP